MCASRKRVETLVGGGARHTTNAPFTYNPRRCPPSPFPPPRRSAPSRYVARSRSRRAREAGPSRREKRRRLRCRVFWRLRPGERGERTRRPAFARTRSTRVVRVRGIVRSNARIPHRGAPEHLLYAPIRATPDATQTLLSGFGGPHHRLAALFRPSKDARARRTTNHERRSPPSITITVTVTVTHRSPRARPLRKRAAAAPSR